MLTRRTFLMQSVAALPVAGTLPSLTALLRLRPPILLSFEDWHISLGIYGLVQKDGVRLRTIGPGFHCKRDLVMLALARHDPQTAHYREMTLTKADYDRLWEIDIERYEWTKVYQNDLCAQLSYDVANAYPNGYYPAALSYYDYYPRCDRAWTLPPGEYRRGLYRNLIAAGRLPAAALGECDECCTAHDLSGHTGWAPLPGARPAVTLHRPPACHPSAARS